MQAILEDPEDPAWISSINLAEALDSIARLQGWPVDEVAEKLRWLIVGGLQVEPVTERLGFVAGRLRTRHYHRQRRPISIADCISLALALELDEELATADPALQETARAENCQVVALPDSHGRIAQ